MAYLGDKRYVKIEFDPGKWSPAVGEGGVVVWNCTAVGGCTVTKTDGGTQQHLNCPVGSKVTTTNGTAVLEIL